MPAVAEYFSVRSTKACGRSVGVLGAIVRALNKKPKQKRPIAANFPCAVRTLVDELWVWQECSRTGVVRKAVTKHYDCGVRWVRKAEKRLRRLLYERSRTNCGCDSVVRKAKTKKNNQVRRPLSACLFVGSFFVD